MFVGGVGGTTAPSPNIPTWFPRGGEPNVPGDDIGRAREDVREPTRRSALEAPRTTRAAISSPPDTGVEFGCRSIDAGGEKV
jgi:hypothetical protein